jgi:hypothetical protein
MQEKQTNKQKKIKQKKVYHSFDIVVHTPFHSKSG